MKDYALRKEKYQILTPNHESLDQLVKCIHSDIIIARQADSPKVRAKAVLNAILESKQALGQSTKHA